MTYPINKEKMLAACEQELGPADETTKELFSLYIDELNRAYREGLCQNQNKVEDFRNTIVDRIGDILGWNDFNEMRLMDIVEIIDEALEEVGAE